MQNQQNKEQLRQELKKRHKKMLVKNFGTEHEQIINEILDIYEAEIKNVDDDGFKFFFELTRQKIHENRKNILPKYLDKRSKNIQLIKGIMNSEGIVKNDKIEKQTKKVWKNNLKQEKKIQRNQFTQTMKNLKSDLQKDQRQKSAQKYRQKLSQTSKKKIQKSSTPNINNDKLALEKSNNFYLQKVEKLVKNLDNEINKDINDKLVRQIQNKKNEIKKSLLNIQRKLDKKNQKKEIKNKKKSKLHLNLQNKRNPKINQLKNNRKYQDIKKDDNKNFAIKVFKISNEKKKLQKTEKKVQIKEPQKSNKNVQKKPLIKDISNNNKQKEKSIKAIPKKQPKKKSINSLESFRKHLSQDSHSIQNLLDRFNKQSLFSNMQHISRIEQKDPSMIDNKQEEEIEQSKSVIQNLNKIQKLVAIYEKRFKQILLKQQLKMKIIYIFIIITILFNKTYQKRLKRNKQYLKRKLVTPPGGGGADGKTKEIPGTKISITPPPQTLKDIPPKPIIVQPLYVKQEPHKAKLQLRHMHNFRNLQQQFPMPYYPMAQSRNLNQQVFVKGASVQNGGTDGSIVLDGEDSRSLQITPILQHQRQVTLNTHSIQKLELTHQNNEGIKFALQKLIENIAGLDSLQEELIHKIEAKVEIYEGLVQESKSPGKEDLKDGKYIPYEEQDKIIDKLRRYKPKKANRDIFLNVKNNFFKEIYFYFHNTRQFDEEKFQQYILKHFKLQIEDETKNSFVREGKLEDEIESQSNEEQELQDFSETQKIPPFKEIYSVYDTANKYKLFNFRIHANGLKKYASYHVETKQQSGGKGLLSLAKSLISGPGTKEKFSSMINIIYKNITVVLYNKDNNKEFHIRYSLYNNERYLDFQTQQIHSFLRDVRQHVFSMTQIQEYLYKTLKIELLIFPYLKDQLSGKEPKDMDQEILKVNPEFNLEPDVNRKLLQDTYSKYISEPEETKKLNQFYIQMISPVVHENQMVIDLFRQRLESIEFFKQQNLNEFIENKEWVVFVLTPVDQQQDSIFMYGVFKYNKQKELQQQNGLYFYTESNQLNQQFEIKTFTYNYIVQQFNYIVKEVKQNLLFYFQQIQIDFKGQKADIEKLREILPNLEQRNQDDQFIKLTENLEVEDKYTLSVSNGQNYYSKKSYPIYSQFNPFTNMQYFYDSISQNLKFVESPCPIGYDLSSDNKCHNKTDYQDVKEFNQADKNILVYAENLQQSNEFQALEMVLSIRWHSKNISSFQDDNLESFKKETIMEPEFYCKWDFIQNNEIENSRILL